LVDDRCVRFIESPQRFARKVNEHEIVRRVKIILATLIDDSQVAVPNGLLVGKDPIDFMSLQ
jgi:hypothetical protein